MQPLSEHPTDNELAAFIEGNANNRSQIEAHLEHCTNCMLVVVHSQQAALMNSEGLTAPLSNDARASNAAKIRRLWQVSNRNTPQMTTETDGESLKPTPAKGSGGNAAIGGLAALGAFAAANIFDSPTPSLAGKDKGEDLQNAPSELSDADENPTDPSVVANNLLPSDVSGRSDETSKKTDSDPNALDRFLADSQNVLESLADDLAEAKEATGSVPLPNEMGSQHGERDEIGLLQPDLAEELAGPVQDNWDFHEDSSTSHAEDLDSESLDDTSGPEDTD